jgi:hypothetical protein
MRFTRLVLVLLICFVFIRPIQVKAVLVIPSCPHGQIIGHPPINQVPTYDYAADGLVQFHFHFSIPEWNYNTLKVGLYDENCFLESEPGRGQVGGVYLAPVKNLLVKVAPSEPGKYNFKVYDEDTGNFQGIGLGFVPNDFNASQIGITLSNVTGSINAPIIDIVTTPVVPLHITDQAPQREPVLIIPGVTGTELFEGQDLLWPNLSRMLTDIGDNFLDDLAFNSDLTATNGSVTAGDLVKEPFPGEHYYDSLIESLEQNGYTENQDLFVFPYDWRFGISESIVADLAERIHYLAAGHKVNIIAHSTGGLLLKKVVQENGATDIDKAIMVGVPNYGAAKAAKVLLYGDDMGIPWLDGEEIKKIGLNMPAMYDLLPTPQYSSAYGSYFQQAIPDLLNPKLNKLDFRAAADHLTNDYSLNWLAFRNAENLHTYAFDNLNLSAAGVNVFTLAGCGAPTLKAITEIKQPFGPSFFPSPIQPAIVSGDGTVGLSSAIGNNPTNQLFYLLYANHGKLPGHSGATEVINDILKGDPLENFISPLVTRDENRCKFKGKLISILGDVAVQVKTAAGVSVYPDTTLGNASDIQLIHQLSYNILHLPSYVLGGTVEVKSLSDNNEVNIQVDDANVVENDSPPEKVFSNIKLQKNSMLTLSGLDGFEPIIDVPVSDLPAAPVDSVHSSSGHSSGKVSAPAKDSFSFIQLPGQGMLPHPEHSLVKFGPTIYIIESGQRRGFRTYGEFLSYGYSTGQVLEGNVADWNLPEGLVMLAKSGVLAQDTANFGKYYLLNEILEKQWISSKAILKNLIGQLGSIFDIDLSGYRVGINM